MRNYEIMFIVNPTAADEDVDKINGQIEGVITAGGGKAEKIEKLGKRRLAYIVKKFREGSFVLFTVQADGAIIREVERRLDYQRRHAIGQHLPEHQPQVAGARDLRDTVVENLPRQRSVARLGEEQVLRFEVAMNDTSGVKRIQAARDLFDERDDVQERECFLRAEDRGEIASDE